MEPPRQEQSQRAVSRSPGVNKTKKVATKSKYRPVRIRHTGTLKTLSRGHKNAVKSLTKKLNIHDDALKILKTYLDDKEKTDGADMNKRMEVLEETMRAIAEQMAKTPTEKVKEKIEYLPVFFRGWKDGIGYVPYCVRSDSKSIYIDMRGGTHDGWHYEPKPTLDLDVLLTMSELKDVTVTLGGNCSFILNNIQHKVDVHPQVISDYIEFVNKLKDSGALTFTLKLQTTYPGMQAEILPVH